VRVDHADGARYRQLQTLRLYASERLDELDERAAVGERHARWFLDEARRAATGLVGPDAQAWRVRVREEFGDLRRALEWFVSRGESCDATALVNGLAWAWFLAAEWHEAIRWFDAALGSDGPDDERRALARQWRAYFTVFASPNQETQVEAREAHARLRAATSPGRRRASGLLFASTLNRLGCFDEALASLAETRAALDPSDEWGVAMCDLLTANAAVRLGDLGTTEAAAASSARHFERLGDRSVLIEALGLLAQLATIRGELDEGARRYTELVEHSRAFDLPGYLVFWLIARGIVHLRRSDAGAAASDFAEAAERSRNPVNTAAALLGAARAAALRRRPADAELARAADLLDRIEHTEGRRTTLALRGLDHVDRGELEEAAVIADHLDTHRSDIGSLVRGAIAVAEGDAAAAARLLSRFDAVREQAISGNFGGLLAAEHERLRYLVAR
jgi:tetratricopeptide (TPR) repeat protein